MNDRLSVDRPLAKARPCLLLVEDEPLIIDLMEENLRAAGFDVVALTTGTEGVDELEKESDKFSGLITDIRLVGGFSGWDVARRARQLWPRMPVVYVTGDSYSDWTAKGVPDSVMIEKPFAPLQVVVAISALIHAVPLVGGAARPVEVRIGA